MDSIIGYWEYCDNLVVVFMAKNNKMKIEANIDIKYLAIRERVID